MEISDECCPDRDEVLLDLKAESQQLLEEEDVVLVVGNAMSSEAAIEAAEGRDSEAAVHVEDPGGVTIGYVRATSPVLGEHLDRSDDGRTMRMPRTPLTDSQSSGGYSRSSASDLKSGSEISASGTTATVHRMTFARNQANQQLRRTPSTKKKLGSESGPALKEKDVVHHLLRNGGGSPMRSSLGSSLKRTQSLSRPISVGPNQPAAVQCPVSNGTAKPRGDRPTLLRASKSKVSTSTMSMSMTLSMSSGAISIPACRPVNSPLTESHRATPPSKLDCWPRALSRNQSVSMQRLVQRTPSLSTPRTPGTPSEDGYWPGSGGPASEAVAARRNIKRGSSVTSEMHTARLEAADAMATSVVEMKNNAYGTLPRRRKQKSVEDLTTRSSRSSSISRDSRYASSPAQAREMQRTAPRNLTPGASKAFGGGGGGGINRPGSMASRNLMSRLGQANHRTRIYHETSVQTTLTGSDLSKIFAGGTVTTARPIEAADQRDQQSQTDIRDRELERLQEEVRLLTQRELDLSVKLKREREEKSSLQQELHLNAQRVVGILQLARISIDDQEDTAGSNGSGDDDLGPDSLLMLESQIHEVGRLRKLCRSLQQEIDRSLTMQENLLQEKAAIEQEYSEIQDFLHDEKMAMCEALKELEAEHQICQHRLVGRDEEVKVLRDECRHLVRLNEQRRQENRTLQSKYVALETKSKDMLMQQNFSMTGTSAALTRLLARLDSLVGQLVTSYSISEQNLEDMMHDQQAADSYEGIMNNSYIKMGERSFSNGVDAPQAQHRSFPKLDKAASSAAGSLVPQRNQSFIAAVISAIRNSTMTTGRKAASHEKGNAADCGTAKMDESKHSVAPSNGQMSNGLNNNNTVHSSNGDDSDSTEMLDSETEPCLIMDNVLEDVSLPDTHSHNMMSSCCGLDASFSGASISKTEMPSEFLSVSGGDESLQNLSKAIVDRQHMESQINALDFQKATIHLSHTESSNPESLSGPDALTDLPALAECYSSSSGGVVEQAIELDGLVTKLLKVLRLIQMDNDNCIQQLIVDKNKLQQNQMDLLEKLKDIQDVNIKLQDELMDATQQLMLKNTEVTSSNSDIQRHHNEIDSITTSNTPESIVQKLNVLKIGQRKEKYVQELVKQINTLNNPLLVNVDNRLNVFAKEFENDIDLLHSCTNLETSLQQLQHGDIEDAELNANQTALIQTKLRVNNNSASLVDEFADVVLSNDSDRHGTRPAEADVNANSVE